MALNIELSAALLLKRIILKEIYDSGIWNENNPNNNFDNNKKK